MSWSVIIPSNVASKLRKCVYSIVSNHPKLDSRKIIIVDDGARAEWSPSDIPVTWVEGVKPFIYARNVNLGIHACTDDVVILGDDVLVKSPNGFDFLAETAQRKNVAAVSAGITGIVGNPYQQRKTESIVRESPNELCFVCLYLPRTAIDSVGLLDEDFVWYGGEDIDWSLRAQSLGLRLLVDDRCGVLHNDKDMPSAFRTKPSVGVDSVKAIEHLKKKWPERFK